MPKINKNCKSIKRTRKVLTLLEKKDPLALYKNDLTIKDINLLSERFKKEPTLQGKINNAIEENRFNFKKFIEELRREEISRFNDKARTKKSNLTNLEKKTFIDYLKNKKIPSEKAKEIVELFSEKYTKQETKEMITSIAKINKNASASETNFIMRKIFLGIDGKKRYLPGILKRISSQRHTLEQQKQLLYSLLPNL